MKKIYTILIFLLLSTIAFAQPGYMGKRLCFSYNLNISPIVAGANYKGETKPFLDFNTINSVRLDYVTSRKNSIGFQVGYVQSSLAPQNYDYTTSNNYSYNYYGNTTPTFNAYNFYENGHPFKLHAFSYHLLFRKYYGSSGNLAPFGSYTELGLGVQNQYVYDKFIEDYVTSNFVPFLSIAYGSQRVYFDRILFDVSLRFTLYPQYIITNGTNVLRRNIDMSNSSNNAYFPELSYNQRMEKLKDDAIARAQMLDLITIKVGFGMLVK